MDRELDLALHGALGADPALDDRDPHDVASMVCAEIAAGADIVDACAACAVAPSMYLQWVHSDDAHRERHAKALAIRDALDAERPRQLARALRDAREGRAPLPDGVKLTGLAGALEAEARLVKLAREARSEGAGPGREGGRVHISFDQLPSHPPTASASVGQHVETLALSDGDSDVYVVSDGDELDD